MNHTYRVVYNETTNTYIAVAENVSARGKSSKSKKAIAAVMATVALQLVPLTSEAAVAIGTTSGDTIQQGTANVTTTSGSQGVAIGSNVTAVSRNSVMGSKDTRTTAAIGIGYNTSAYGNGVIAIGSGATAYSYTQLNVNGGSGSGQGIAIGANTSTTGDQSVALGADTKASGNSSVAIGGDDLDSVSKVNINGATGVMSTSATELNGGTLNEAYKSISGQDLLGGTRYRPTSSSGQGSVAVGVQAVSEGHLSTAFGTQTHAAGLASTAIGIAANSSGNGSFAAGPAAKALGARAIGIGANANATNANATAIGTNAQAKYFGDIVIGTNAIANGTTLGASTIGETKTGSTPNVVIGYNASSNSRFGDTLIGAWSSSKNTDFEINQVTAVGNRAYVYGDQGVAIGADTHAYGNSSVAMGSDDIDKAAARLAGLVGVDYQKALDKATAEVTAEYDALPDSVKASNPRDAWIAERAVARATQSVTAKLGNFRANTSGNVQAGLSSNAFYPNTAAIGDVSVAIGATSQSLGVASNAIGVNALSRGDASTAIGLLSRADATNTIAIGTGANASQESSIVMGANSSAQDSAIPNLTTLTNASSVVIGTNSHSNGTNVVIGSNNTANGEKNILIGNKNRMNNFTSAGFPTTGNVLIGDDLVAESSIGNTIIGTGTRAGTNNARDYGVTAIGSLSQAYYLSIALGTLAKADTNPTAYVENVNMSSSNPSRSGMAGAVAIGSMSRAHNIGEGHTALGTNAWAQNRYSNALGAGSTSWGVESNAFGYSAMTHGTESTAIGSYARTSLSAHNSTAIGRDAHVYSNNSIAFGSNASVAGSVLGTGVYNGRTDLVGFTNNIKKISTLTEQNLNDAYDIAVSNALASTDKVGSIDLEPFEIARNLAEKQFANNMTAQNMALMEKARSIYTRAELANKLLAKMKAEHNTTLVTENATAIGTNAFAANQNSTAVGTGSIAIGNRSIAIGTEAKATGNQSLSIGTGNVVSGDFSGAFGDPSIVAGTNSYSVGNNNIIANNTDNAISIGGQNNIGGIAGTRDKTTGIVSVAGGVRNMEGANRSMVMGFRNKVFAADDSMVIGNNNEVTAPNVMVIGNNNEVTASNVMVLGNNITTANESAVILGNESSGHENATIEISATVNGVTYGGFTGTPFASSHYVSVGATGNNNKRQIKNVAAGNISATSTDAINGSQLYMIANQITTTNPLFNQENGTISTTTFNNTPNLVNATTVANAINNSGWNVYQGDTTPANKKDLVNPGDNVVFANGAGTTASVESDSTNTTVKYNVAVDNKTTQLISVDASGNPLVKAANGNYYPAGTQMDAVTGNPVDPATQAVKPAGTRVAAKTTELAPKIVDADGNEVPVANTAVVDGKLYNKTDLNPATNKPNAGAKELTANSGAVATPVAPNSLVNASTVANAINNSGFNVIADKVDAGTNSGEKAPEKKLIKPGETVKFVAGNNMDIEQNGSTFIFRTNNQKVVENAQLPVVYTNKDGDRLVKGQDGNFYKSGDIANLVYNPKEQAYYPAGTITDASGNPVDSKGEPATKVTPIGKGDVIASMNNGDSNTTVPMTLTNVKGNLPNTYNKDTLTPNGDPSNVDNPVTESQTLPSDQKVNVNNAATVGDVLNAGWNLKENGDAKDFVKPYDTVNFVNGAGTTANVTVTDGGKVSNVTYNVAVDNKTTQLISVDASGNPLVKAANGNYYPAGTQMDAVTGNPVDPATQAVKPAGTRVAAKTTELAPKIVDADGNEVPVANTAVVDGKLYNKTDLNPATNKPNAGAKELTANSGAVATPVAPNSLVNASTVANAINNSGFNVIADKVDAGTNSGEKAPEKKLIKPGETVKFVAGNNMDIEQNGSTFIFRTNNQKVVENAQLPVVYTNKDGDRLVKGQDGNFYKPTDIANATYDPDTKKYTNTKAGTTVDPETTVIASMNNGDNNTTAPMTLANVQGNLSPSYNKGDNTVNKDGKPTDTLSDTYDANMTAPTPDVVKKMYNNAATVGDVLNAGWNLQENGVAKDFVKPYDTVNFVNGAGTTANVTVNPNGTVANVTYNVAVDNKTTQLISVDGKGNPLVQAADGNYYPAGSVKIGDKYYPAGSKDDGTGTGKVVSSTGAPVDPLEAVKLAGTQVAAKTTNLTVNNGKVDTPTTNGSSLVNAETVANAINNSGFTLKAQSENGSVVNPGGTVDMKNTDGNIVISKTTANNDVVYNLAKNITVDNVTAGNTTVNNAGITIKNTGPNKIVSLTNAGLNNGGNKITNVAEGTADTDAVNVKQLKNFFVDAKLGAITELNPSPDGSIEKPTDDNGGKLVNATTVAKAINDSGWNLQANGDIPSKVSPGNTVQFLNGDNINITRNGNSITVATSRDINVKGDLTVAGNTTVNNFTVNPNSTVNMGGNKVQGVAAGVISANSTDAINGSQLYYTNQNINNVANNLNARINDVADDADAGTASAMATAGIPQAYLPGKSMVAVGASTYRGKQGYAVGFSAISDSGNWIIKGTASGNSRGHFGATVGAGYQW